jgi:hypothetical protein
MLWRFWVWLLLAGVLAGGTEAAVRVRVISRAVFLAAPGLGVGIMANSAYTRPTGDDVLCRWATISRSDTCDTGGQRFSSDNGRTWGAPTPIVLGETRTAGTFRRHLRAMAVEPGSGAFLTFRTEGVLPSDHPLEGLKQWAIFYTVSLDGGRTDVVDEQIVCAGPGYDAEHPLPGIRRGKSSYMLGDLTCMPLTLPDGTVLLPCQVTPTNADDEYVNPGAGFTFHDALVLRGRWGADHRLQWEASARVKGDPARTTRGLFEPTLGLLADGSVLMVMRGSNDGKPNLPGYRWQARSTDGGRTWSAPAPWTFHDGTAFSSPSACSLLLRHSSGTLFWIGNIAPANPKGNGPRYPLVIGVVDAKTGLLVRDSVTVIDTRGPDDAATLTLSNFGAREDRRTGEILIHLSRLGADAKDFWHADALVYRVGVEGR